MTPRSKREPAAQQADRVFTVPKPEFALPDRALQLLPGHRRGLGPCSPALPGKDDVKLRHLAAIEPHAPAGDRSETRWQKLDFRCGRANWGE